MRKILKIDEGILKPFFESYSEMKYDILMKLKKTNKEYRDLLDKKEKILDEFPNLRDIIEFDYNKALSKEEAKGFVEL